MSSSIFSLRAMLLVSMDCRRACGAGHLKVYIVDSNQDEALAVFLDASGTRSLGTGQGRATSTGVGTAGAPAQAKAMTTAMCLASGSRHLHKVVVLPHAYALI